MSLSTQDPELAELLELARSLARERARSSASATRPHLSIETKSATIDLVTEVDRACEVLIVEGMQAASVPATRSWPRRVGGERHGGRGEWRWIIDPLDGTTNFAHGYPRFCVSIGIESTPAERRRRASSTIPCSTSSSKPSRRRGAGSATATPARLATESELGRALLATGFAYDVHRATTTTSTTSEAS